MSARHLLITFQLAACAVAFCAGPPAPKPGPPHVVTVATRDYTVEFAGDRAWTICRIVHKGAVLGDKTGFYGTVLIPAGGKFIGTGHTEGGVEKIGKVELTVDGKPCELRDKAVYRGSRAVLAKRSVMGPLQLEAAYIVTDDCVLERHRYEALEDTKLHLLYAFMHCWLARTTEWTAEKTDGNMVEGRFDSNGDFELRQDVKWTALYDPESRRAALAWYPVPLAGQGHKTAYWDKTAYHKLYNQICSGTPLAKGANFEAAVVVRGVEADAATWKDAVRAAAADTKARFGRGALCF
jgi:hypothetical protein